jgi:homoserine O-acetyltransferase
VSSSFVCDIEARVCALDRDFVLEQGGVLVGPQLGYELVGRTDGPLVGILGGISAGRHVAAHAANQSRGFWDDLVGAERAIDPARVAWLGFDWLGGAGLSTGPKSSGMGARFPAVTSRDQARALARLLDHLGRQRFDVLIGASFGGMTALAFAEEFGARVGELVVLCAAHQTDPLSSAWRRLQREALVLGERAGDPALGVEFARKLAFTTYRGRADWVRRGADAESWLAARGRDFARTFDADVYRVLSTAIDEHRVDPRRITTPTTLVGFDSDMLVPIEQMRDLAARLAGPVRTIEIETPYGHDGFLKESRRIDGVLREVLARRSEVLS